MFDKHALKDYFWNILFSCLIIFGAFFVVRIAGNVYPAHLLGLFLLTRYIATAGSNFFQFGISQTLVRYLSLYNDNPVNKKRFLLVAIALWFIGTILLFPLVWYFSSDLELFLFPAHAKNGSYALCLFFIISSMIGQYIVSSSLMADRQFILSNICQFLGGNGFIILLLLLYGQAYFPITLFYVQSIITYVMTLIGLSYLYVKYSALSSITDTEADLNTNILSYTGILKNFFHYGVPQGMVAFLDTVIISIGPWILRGNPTDAGYLIIALTLLRAIQAGFAPLTQVTGVLTGHAINKNQQDQISNVIPNILKLVLISSLFLTIFLFHGSYVLLVAWLNNKELALAVNPFLNFAILAIIPCNIYYGLKDIIAARWHKPYNLISLMLGLTSFFVVYFFNSFSSQTEAILYSIIATYTVAGLSTIVWIRQDLKSLFSYRDFLVVFLVIIYYLVNHYMLQGSVMNLIQSGIMALFFGIMAVIFLFPSSIKILGRYLNFEYTNGQ